MTNNNHHVDGDCSTCAYNKGFEPWPETKLPCGQFNCWDYIHSQVDESSYEDYEPDYE